MPKFQPYSDTFTRNLVRNIINKVVKSIDPEEEIPVQSLTDKIVKDYENGKIVKKEEAKTSGSSNIDLMVLIVVPIVVQTLKNIIEQGFKLDKWRSFNKKDKETVSTLIEDVVDEKFQQVTIRIKSQKSLSKKKAIKKATKLFTKQVLGIVEAEDLPKTAIYRLAGDSTIDAPPPAGDVKKKKRKGK
jgi:hypothetical protein